MITQKGSVMHYCITGEFSCVYVCVCTGATYAHVAYFSIELFHVNNIHK